MVSISEVFNFIGRTNLFNFAIFLGIIIWLCKHIDVAGKLEAAKNDVANNIEDSKTAKAESETDLKKIEDSFAHVADEISDILKKSEENAKLVGDKILEDAQKNVSNIKENTQKSVENKSQLIKNDILTRASEASIEVAKNHIVNELRNNPSLHDKLINDSINALDGVNLRAGL